MWATIAWSYDLLSVADRALFRRLVVFAGGCTVEAIDALFAVMDCRDAEVLKPLQSLVDKCLLRQCHSADGEMRFGMLETIREYGLEQLAESGELEGVRLAHAQYFQVLAEQAEPALRGAEQVRWLTQLEVEHDSFRAALHWCLQAGGDCALGLSLARYLGLFWEKLSHLTAGRLWLEQPLARQLKTDAAVRAAALNWPHRCGGR
jgi:predicted ATPase